MSARLLSPPSPAPASLSPRRPTTAGYWLGATVAEPDARVVCVEGARPLPAHPDVTVTVTGPGGNDVRVEPSGGDLRYDVPAHQRAYAPPPAR